MEESCGAVTTLPTRGPSRNSASAPDARLDLVVTRLELLQCLLIAAPFADEDFAELDVVEREKGTERGGSGNLNKGYEWMFRATLA